MRYKKLTEDRIVVFLSKVYSTESNTNWLWSISNSGHFGLGQIYSFTCYGSRYLAKKNFEQKAKRHGWTNYEYQSEKN